MTEEEMVEIELDIEPELLAKANEKAKELGVTLDEFFQIAMNKYLKKILKEEKEKEEIKMSKVSAMFFDNDLMFEQLFYLPSVVNHAPDELINIIEDMSDEDIQRIFKINKEKLVEISGQDQWLDKMETWEKIAVIQEWFYDLVMEGFIAIVATPVQHFDKKEETSSFSWGEYFTKCIYGEDMEDLVEKSVRWAEEMYKSQKEG